MPVFIPSSNCTSVIKHFEQLRLKAYLPTKDDVPTIGWGHTEGVLLGDTCTEAEAKAFLRDDMALSALWVNKWVSNIPTTQNQYDALVSFTFNVGLGAAGSSSLIRFHKQGVYGAAAGQFHKWVHQGKKVLRGLVTRRALEEDLYGWPEETPWSLAEALERVEKKA